VPHSNPRRSGALRTNTDASQEKFFALAERFRDETEPIRAARLGDQLGRLVFAGPGAASPTPNAPQKGRRR